MQFQVQPLLNEDVNAQVVKTIQNELPTHFKNNLNHSIQMDSNLNQERAKVNEKMMTYEAFLKNSVQSHAVQDLEELKISPKLEFVGSLQRLVQNEINS